MRSASMRKRSTRGEEGYTRSSPTAFSSMVVRAILSASNTTAYSASVNRGVVNAGVNASALFGLLFVVFAMMRDTFYNRVVMDIGWWTN